MINTVRGAEAVHEEAGSEAARQNCQIKGRKKRKGKEEVLFLVPLLLVCYGYM